LRAVAGALYVVVLGFFLVGTRPHLQRAIRRLIPAARLPEFDELWVRLGGTLRRWTGGVLVSMTIMGAVTGLGLWIAGISSPLLLGVVTFCGTFIPYLGALASAIPGLAIALSQSPCDPGV
jgi:predicted PurR-regulated permease PerM